MGKYYKKNKKNIRRIARKNKNTTTRVINYKRSRKGMKSLKFRKFKGVKTIISNKIFLLAEKYYNKKLISSKKLRKLMSKKAKVNLRNFNQISNIFETKNDKSIEADKRFIRPYSPANKQWKNSIYCYNNNTMVEAWYNNDLVYSLIKKFFFIKPIRRNTRLTYRRMLKKHNNVRRVFISKPEIKHNNDKVIITIYPFSKEVKKHIRFIFYDLRNLSSIVPKFHEMKLKDKLVNFYQTKFLSKLDKQYSFLKLPESVEALPFRNKKRRYLNRFINNKNKKKVYKFNFNNDKYLRLKDSFSWWIQKQIRIPYLEYIFSQLSTNITIYSNNITINYPKSFFSLDYNKYKFSEKDKNLFNMPSYNIIKNFINTLIIKQKCFDLLNLIPTNYKKIVFPIRHMNVKLNKIDVINDDIKYKSYKWYNVLDRIYNPFLLISEKVNLAIKSTYGNIFSKKFLRWYNIIVLNIVKKIFGNQLYSRQRLTINQYRLKNLFKLKYLLEKLFNKKVQLNIVNLKYIHSNADNFTAAISMKLRKKKFRLSKLLKKSKSIVRTQKKVMAHHYERYNFTKIFNFSKILKKNLHILKYTKRENILNKIKYKWTTGLRIELKGRLSKRFVASRSIFKFKKKGDLKNLYGSKKEDPIVKTYPSVVKIRSITDPNVQYSYTKGRRRIGCFGVKSWISNN